MVTRAQKLTARSLAALLAASGALGCAAAPAAVARPVRVEVPVLKRVPCAAPKLEAPPLPIAQLKADSAPANTIRAYAATVVILKGAVRERDAVIAGCASTATTE